MSKNGTRKANRKNQQRGRRTRLSVQALESRKLLAGDIGLTDGMIAINGTDGNDIAEVYLHDDAVSVSLTSYNEDGTTAETHETFQQSEVEGIVFDARAGDDLLVNDTSFDSIMRAGSGNDTILGGQGNDILAAGTGDDVVLGGGGDDVILGGPGIDVAIMPTSQTVPESSDEMTTADDVDESSDLGDDLSEDTESENNGSGELQNEAIADTPSETTPAETPAELSVGSLAIEDSLEPLTEENGDETSSEDLGDEVEVEAIASETEDSQDPMESCSNDSELIELDSSESESTDSAELTDAGDIAEPIAAELLSDVESTPGDDETAETIPVPEMDAEPVVEASEIVEPVLADPLLVDGVEDPESDDPNQADSESDSDGEEDLAVAESLMDEPTEVADTPDSAPTTPPTDEPDDATDLAVAAELTPSSEEAAPVETTEIEMEVTEESASSESEVPANETTLSVDPSSDMTELEENAETDEIETAENEVLADPVAEETVPPADPLHRPVMGSQWSKTTTWKSLK